MSADRRRELKKQYKAKPVTGGICRIECNGNHHARIQATVDIESLRNRFNFALLMDSPPDPSFRADWEQFGCKSFSFTVLEELEKGETQTDKEFADDINALYEIWLDKTQAGELA